LLFDLMRKRYLLDYAMFAESDNFVGESSGEGVEATTDESPFLEGGTSAEGAAEENEGAAEESEDVNVDS
jgi:hypothetical protein